MLFLENCLKNYYNKMLWEVTISSHLPKNNFLTFPPIYFFRKLKDSTNHLLQTLWLDIIILISLTICLPKDLT